MKCFITGGAGFIGSHMVDRLIKDNEVTVYDSLTLGKKSNIGHHMKNPKFRFVEADLLDAERLAKEMKGHDIVFHLAANSDIAYGTAHTDADLKIGTIATYNILEAMRANGIKKIVFTSSSAIYGEADVVPIPESYGPLQPISFYGASKLACEALISAFCHNYGFQAWVFRLANIVGPRPTHGVILDFVRKLMKNPKELEILGNGKQTKTYLEVSECIDGMLFCLKNADDQFNLFNLASAGSTSVEAIAKMIISGMGLKGVKINYTGGSRGWKGDVPKVSLDVTKINALGWKARLDSDGAVRSAVAAIVKDLPSP